MHFLWIMSRYVHKTQYTVIFFIDASVDGALKEALTLPFEMRYHHFGDHKCLTDVLDTCVDVSWTYTETSSKNK